MNLFLLGLLGAVGMLGLADILGGNDNTEEEPDTPDEPAETNLVTPEEPTEDGDIGASVIENEDGSIHVELGDDETGSIVAIKFDVAHIRGDYSHDFSLGLFLVPEGSEVPINPTWQFYGSQSFEDAFAGLGLTELTSFELGTMDHLDFGTDDTRIDPPEVTSDDPIDIIRMNMRYSEGPLLYINTETDETLSPFEAPGVFYNGVERVDTADDYVGTSETDFVRADGPAGTAGVAINGLGGDDHLVSYLDESVLDGGAGDDTIYTFGNNSDVQGGVGDDHILVATNSTAHGGDGNDFLFSYTNGVDGDYHGSLYDLDGPTDEGTQLYGDAGDDELRLSHAAVIGHGGSGNDELNISHGASGFGDAGDDTFEIGAGSIADGGEGDDNFTISVTQGNVEEMVTLTGGAGSDVYQFDVSGGLEDLQTEYVQITDFNPDEDVLKFNAWGYASLDDIRVEEAADGSYSDVISEFTRHSSTGAVTTTMITRLVGVSGYSASELVA